MKLLSTFVALITLGVATSGQAQSITQTTITITIPKAVVWVAADGTPIAPYLSGGPAFFFDLSGHVWRLNDLTSAMPTASGYYGPLSPSALWFESFNCSGTAYLVFDSYIASNMVVEAESGWYVRDATLTSFVGTLNSRFIGGSCAGSTLTVPGQFVSFRIVDMQSVGLPPMLPLGPYRMEYR
jgi:hypothetical protein